jgi:hypothetical protein
MFKRMKAERMIGEGIREGKLSRSDSYTLRSEPD